MLWAMNPQKELLKTYQNRTIFCVSVSLVTQILSMPCLHPNQQNNIFVYVCVCVCVCVCDLGLHD